MRRFLYAMIVTVALGLGAAPAIAEKRIALLIGNQDYALDKLDLKNPHNDIAHVAAALKKVGFDVTLVKDAGLGKIQRELRRYTAKLRKAGSSTIGFFYYSGHGALNEDTRTNYLIPVDVENIDSEELWYSSVRLRRVIDELESQAGNAQHFVVFGACRNSLQLASKTSKSLLQSKGFKAEREVRGMLISYATAEGKIASDVGDTVGPYASALAAEITKPGVEAVTMFRNVQFAVQNAINQQPWLRYGALNKTYFAGEEDLAAKERKAWNQANQQNNLASLKRYLSYWPEGAHAVEAKRRIATLEEAASWQIARQRGTVAELEVFLSRYPSGRFSATARQWILDLKGEPPSLTNSSKKSDAESRITEIAFWQAAEAKDTVWAYLEYLRSHQNGLFRQKAFDRIAALQKQVPRKTERKQRKSPSRSPEQILSVGLGYYKGSGGEKNLTKAAKNFAKAAEAGQPQAMYWLGHANELGEGVPKNLDLAVRWYQRAARKNVSLAQNALGNLYRNGIGVSRDYSLALTYYEQAAGQGLPDAMTSIGVIYASGRGNVPKNYAKAVDWYRRAAEKGSAIAMNNLGVMYAKGRGVARDDGRAVSWYKKAAAKGHVAALLNIAWRYDSGLGVPSDPETSSQYFVSAVQKGGDEARQTLLKHADKLSNETRMEIQRRLREAGQDIGTIDGRFGSRTSQALKALAVGK